MRIIHRRHAKISYDVNNGKSIFGSTASEHLSIIELLIGTARNYRRNFTSFVVYESALGPQKEGVNDTHLPQRSLLILCHKSLGVSRVRIRGSFLARITRRMFSFGI